MYHVQHAKEGLGNYCVSSKKDISLEHLVKSVNARVFIEDIVRFYTCRFFQRKHIYPYQVNVRFFSFFKVISILYVANANKCVLQHCTKNKQ